MNILNFKKAPEDKRFAGSTRRSTAAMIDIWIVLFARVLVMQVLGSLWLNKSVENFMIRFQENFGTATIKNTQEHIDYIIHDRIFYYAIFFYALVIMVGAIYHAYLNSSAWQGTIGKRVMKILIVKEDESKITFGTGMWHYFLSVLPFAFVLYLVSYQVRHNLNFYQTVTASEMNVFLGIIFIIWVQIHLFTRRKTTAYDLICKTILINGKTAAKWPWSK